MVRRHPSVLSVRWQIYVDSEWWEAAWIVSKALCEVLPDTAETWICQANSLQKYRGSAAAADLLIETKKKFPQHPIVSYNLACYLAQINRFDEAGRHLTDAFRLEEGIALKVASVHDPDLKPLWEKIGGPSDLLAAGLSNQGSPFDGSPSN